VTPPIRSGAAPLIDARGIVVEAAGHRILNGVDLAVRPGEIVTVVGPNGSGKTTLLRVLVGALRPAAGTVQRHAELRIGYVPQRLSIDRTLPMTVARFLALAGGSRTAAAAALAEAGIEGLESRQMAALSGGQFQRVLLAHALLRRPTLLVLDEPTQGLDQPGSAAFYALIAELRRRRGIAVLMVSHELHVVMRASDRVVCLNGHVCCEGAPADVTADPAWLALFGPTAAEVMALYAHTHDHSHDADCDHRPAALEQAP
jgi:zinc transport system ATP-binding protein